MLSSRAQGFTLVEIMVVVALAGAVLLTAITLVTSQLSQYSYQTAINHLHDNARLALRVLREDIAKAGFSGCVSLQSGLVDASDHWRYPLLAQDSYSKSVGVDGNSNRGDKIILNIAEPLGLSIEPMADANSAIQLSGSAARLQASAIEADDILVISDCQSAALLRVDSVASGHKIQYQNLNNNSQALPKAFGQSNATYTEVLKQHRLRYFLQRPSRKGASLALFKEVGPPSKRQRYEVVEGIDDLQFQFAVVNKPQPDCSFDSLSYIEASNIDPEGSSQTVGREAAMARLANTVAVKVTLVARVTAPAGLSANSPIKGADGVIRKAFETTIWLRNSCDLGRTDSV